MKNKLLILMAMFSFLLIFFSGAAYADLLPSVDPSLPIDEVVDDDFQFISEPDILNYLNTTYPDGWIEQKRWEDTDLDADILTCYYDEIEDRYVFEIGTDYGAWEFAVIKQASGANSSLLIYDINNTNNIEIDADAYPFRTGSGAVLLGPVSHIGIYCRSVPEPQTMLLLGAGLMGLAAFGRKRIKK